MNYNDDGGVTDGLADEVDYYYEGIVERLDEIVTELQNKLDSQYDFSHVIDETES